LAQLKNNDMTGRDDSLPKISVVTAVFNRQRYLHDTMKCVLDQAYPHLEYILIDGGSTDGSVEVINKESARLAYWSSESDGGLYDALNKGFSKSTGDILFWLNSDDIIFPGTLALVGKLFLENPELEWLTGAATNIDENGYFTKTKHQIRFRKSSFLCGRPRGIQQESTFFRRSLWEKSGAYIDSNYLYAADYELWCRFFQFSQLAHVHCPLGAFRRHRNQLSQINRDSYQEEVLKIRQHYRSLLTVRERVAGVALAALERMSQKLMPYADY